MAALAGVILARGCAECRWSLSDACDMPVMNVQEMCGYRHMSACASRSVKPHHQRLPERLHQMLFVLETCLFCRGVYIKPFKIPNVVTMFRSRQQTQPTRSISKCFEQPDLLHAHCLLKSMPATSNETSSVVICRCSQSSSVVCTFAFVGCSEVRRLLASDAKPIVAIYAL